MIWLLLAGAVLMAGVIWFLARPLASTQQGAATLQRHELLIVRDRLLAQLNELDAERADQGVDAQVAQDEELRLSAELADVLKRLEGLSAGAATDAEEGGGRRLWVRALAVLALALPAVGGGLYALQNGAMLKNLARIEQGGAATGQVPPMVLEMVARLEKRLEEQPNDASGWARLGVSYVNLGRPAEAKRAYAKAYALEPDNLDVLVDYAWLIYSENPKITDGLAFELYTKLYRAQPQNPDALWFLGFAAYEHADYGKTVKYWDRLLKILPPESPTVEHVRDAVAKAKAKAKAKQAKQAGK